MSSECHLTIGVLYSSLIKLHAHILTVSTLAPLWRAGRPEKLLGMIKICLILQTDPLHYTFPWALETQNGTINTTRWNSTQHKWVHPLWTNTNVCLFVHSFIHSSSSYVLHNFKYSALTVLGIEYTSSWQIITSMLFNSWRKISLHVLIFNGECFPTCFCKIRHRYSRVFIL